MGLNENHILKKGLEIAEKQNFEAALNHFDTFINIDSKNALFGKGLIYSKLEEYKKAIVCFNKILDEYNFSPAFYERGKAFRRINMDEEALNSFERALLLDPENPIILLQKADLLIEMGKFDDSLDILDSVISIYPDLNHAWHLKGDIELIQGKTDEAYENYSKSLELNSDYFYSWIGSGLVFNDLKQFEDAVSCYDSALELNNSFKFLNIFMANSYKALDDFNSALNYLEASLSDDKKFRDAWFEKGNILYLSGDLEGALICYDNASRNDPNYAYVEWTRGNVLKETGDYSEALKSFEKSLEMNDEFLLSWESIAETLYLSGKEEKAEQCNIFIENNFLPSDSKNLINGLKSYYKNQYLNSRTFYESEESFDYLYEYFGEYFGKSSSSQLELMHALDEERKKPYKPSLELRNRLTFFGIANLVIGFLAVGCGFIYGIIYYLIAVFTILIAYRVFTLSIAKYSQFNQMRNNFVYISGGLGLSLFLVIFNTVSLFRLDPAAFIGLMSNHFRRYSFNHYYYSNSIPDPYYGFLMIIGLFILLGAAIYISAFPNYVFKHAKGTEPVYNYYGW